MLISNTIQQGNCEDDYRTCLHCKRKFIPDHYAKTYCTNKCRQAVANSKHRDRTKSNALKRETAPKEIK